MQQVNVEAWYKHEVMSHPTEYPSLYKLELAKNKWKFEHEQAK